MIADYAKAARTAIEVFQEYEVRSVPVSLNHILSMLSRTIQIRTYQEYADQLGVPTYIVISQLGSSQGACICDPCSERYLILVCDTLTVPWERFTIAHELGHIFLRHFDHAETTILARSSISDALYDEMEKEANVFARNLLSPAPAAYELAKNIPADHPPYDVFMSAFHITDSAAQMRKTYLKRDLRDYDARMIAFCKKLTMRSRYADFCSRCGAYMPPGGKYCTSCGQKRDTVRQFQKIPTEIPYEGRRFKICPVCHNAEMPKDGNYCRICGTLLMNYCTGVPFGSQPHRNHASASYCAECGRPTYYASKSYLSMIEKTKRRKPMYYSDGVKYDPETCRVKICPVCGNEEFSEDADYCRICGTDLFNRCENGDNFGQHPNPSNARFCEQCGAPTNYFKRGLLKKYTDFDPDHIEVKTRSTSPEDGDEVDLTLPIF